jgi:hypothetical protein
MFSSNLAIAIYALLWVRTSLADEAPEFATEFQLRILGYPDDSNDPLAKAYLIKPGARFDDQNNMKHDGDDWEYRASYFRPYPDRPNEVYLNYLTLKWTRPSPEPWTVRFFDDVLGREASMVNRGLYRDT